MRKLIIALVMGTALLPYDGFTLGLGDIEVNSALNQELNAEIELLSAAPEDAEALIVKLATREEFARAGLDRPFLLQSLKFASKLKNGVPYITVTTSKPVREPFLNFLIEVDWPKGHLLREYTILLDPPVFMTPESARPAVMDSRPGASQSMPSDGATTRPSMSRPSMSSVPATGAVPRSQASSGAAPAGTPFAPVQNGDYRIKKGDTAWSLANALRPDQSVSVEQMMLAMLRTNPESFINENVNGLKRGYILRIPDRNEIVSVTQAEAVALVRQQNSLWREYQQSMSSGQPASAMNNTGAARSAGAAEDNAGARLSIISAGKGAATGASENLDGMTVQQLRAQLTLAEERLEAERVEKESLQGEVAELEQQVDKMKRLLSIEDQGLARLQSTGQATESTIENEGALDAETGELKSDAELEQAEAADAETKPDTEAEVDTGSEAEVPADEQDESVFVGQQQEMEQSVEEGAVEEEAYVEEPPATDFEQARPQGLIASLLNNPMVLAAAGGGLLLVAALVYMIVKRRRASQAVPAVSAFATDALPADEDSLASVADMIDDNADTDVQTRLDDDDVEDLTEETDTDKFDSDATLVLSPTDDTVITKSESSEEEARDDIIAEADVYLAYGIYQQAEELLQNAIKEHPDNDAYRMKLAETYFASKNSSAFITLATEMQKRTMGEGANWQKIVAIGKDLAPDHALFKGAGVVADVALDDLMPAAEPTMDFNLGEEEPGEVALSPDLDFSLEDISPVELPDAEATLDEASDDEELEFDISEAEAIEQEADVEAEEEFSLDIEASELDITTIENASETAPPAGIDFDLDLNETTAESADAIEEAPVETTAVEEEEAAGIDFDIDVSEAIEETADSIAEVAPAPTGSGDEADIDLSELDDVDEVSTKLDLARAYLDMGDHEGTRSILGEVIAEGNDEQKAEAESLLAEMSA